MPSTTRKRKATGSLEEPTKRLRIDPTTKPPRNSSRSGFTHVEEDDEDDEDEYHREQYESSEDEKVVDTPTTPFSPARKKFPSELKTIKCAYEGCPKTFNRPARLTAHLRSHTNERPFVCPYDDCDKAYLQDKHLQHHIKGSHTKEREYRCDIEGCDKSFMTSTRLKRHKEAHKGRDRFRCTEFPPCNQTFRKHQTLQRHIQSDHLNLSPFSCTYIDSITNVRCNAGFDGPTGLRKHMDRIHGASRPRFFCAECIIPDMFLPDGSAIHPSFSSEAKLQVHIRKEHANCIFCDLKCSSQQQLLQHIDAQHSGKSVEERKTHICTYLGCDKTFTKANNLQTHIRTAHIGERFICGTFGINTHLDVPGFINELGCGDELVSKQSLIDHIRIAHLNLPSINNRNKVPAADFDFENKNGEACAERKPKQRATKASAIDHLLGTSQAADPARNISCPMLGCPHMFIRDYDLQIHLQSAVHNPPPNLPSMSHRPTLDPLIDPALLALSYEPETSGGQEDIDWELQQRALEGGPFWVGAEEDPRGEQDEWFKESSEMRKLIGDDD